MKLKIKDLSKEVKISVSRLRVLLCKPEFSCFTSYSKNELGRPATVFDLNDTSKKMLLRYRRGYIPAENDNTEKYLADNLKLQKQNIKLREALININFVLKDIKVNDDIKYLLLYKVKISDINKIIKDVL